MERVIGMCIKETKMLILQVVSLIYTIMEYVKLFLPKITNYKFSVFLPSGSVQYLTDQTIQVPSRETF